MAYRLGNRILHAGNKLFVTSGINPVWNDLVHYWRFDEASGNAYDSKGSYTLNNNLFTYTTGKKNNSVTTSNRHESYLRNTSTNMGYGSAGTFTMWVWFSEYVSTAIVQSTDSNKGIDFEYYNYVLYYKINGESYINNGITLALNQWNFVGCSWNGTNRKIYYNTNIKTASGSLSSPVDGKLLVGNNPVLSSGLFTGKLDELAYWNRQLSDTEIATLYNSGNGLFY